MKISTSVSHAWRNLDMGEEAVLARLRACGFRYLCDEPASLPEDGVCAFADARRKMMQSAGVVPVKVRAAAQSGFDALIRLIEYSARLEAGLLVVPLLSNESWSRAEDTKANSEFLRSLVPAARDNGVTILIEHAGNYQQPFFTHCAMELNALLDRVDEPDWVGINLNIGNIGRADLDIYPEIRLLGSKIRSVDASDNFFGMPLAAEKEREDLGLAPLMGFLDYDEVMRGLKETAYDGAFNLRLDYPRIFPKNSPFVNDYRLNIFPEELLEQFTRWTRSVCEYMLSSYGLDFDREAQAADVIQEA